MQQPDQILFLFVFIYLSLISIGIIYLLFEVLAIKKQLKSGYIGKHAGTATSDRPDDLIGKQSNFNLAEFLSRHVLSIAGIGAIFIAIPFFLKFVYETSKINPQVKIILGMVIGVALTMLGEHFYSKNRYHGIRAAVSSVGLGIMYLTIFSAYNSFHLITQTATFCFLVLVSVSAGLLANRRRVSFIAALGVLAIYIAPVILLSGKDPGIFLLGYLTILTAGILIFSHYKKWPFLEIIAFVCTALISLRWMIHAGSNYIIPFRWLPLGYPLIFLLLFAGPSLIRNLKKSEKTGWNDILLSFFAPLYALLFGYLVFKNAFWKLEGTYCFSLAACYLLLARLQWLKNRSNTQQLTIYSILTLGFFTLALPMQLDGTQVILGLAIEGTALILIGFLTQTKGMRQTGAAILAFSAIHLSYQSLLMDQNYPNLILNPMLMTAIPIFLMVAFCHHIYSGKNDIVSSNEKIIPGLLLTSEILIFVSLISSELRIMVQLVPDWFSIFGDYNKVIITLFWILTASTLTFIGVKMKSLLYRWMAYVLFSAAALKLFFYDLSTVSLTYRIIAAFCLVMSGMLITYIYHRKTKKTELE